MHGHFFFFFFNSFVTFSQFNCKACHTLLLNHHFSLVELIFNTYRLQQFTNVYTLPYIELQIKIFYIQPNKSAIITKIEHSVIHRLQVTKVEVYYVSNLLEKCVRFFYFFNKHFKTPRLWKQY